MEERKEAGEPQERRGRRDAQQSGEGQQGGDPARVWLGPGCTIEREMLLVPFLSPVDLLRLSEAATWLVPYRYKLSGVCLRTVAGPNDPRWALLSGQQRLERVRLTHSASAGDALQRLPGEGAGVRKLDLTDTELSLDQHAEEVEEALQGRSFPALEVLTLGSADLAPLARPVLRGVMSMLERGGCPVLKELRIDYGEWGEVAATGLAQAVWKGHCRGLTVLHLQGRDELKGVSINSLLATLYCGWWPVLNELKLHARLDKYLCGGMRGLPALQVLRLLGSPMAQDEDEEGAAGLVRALDHTRAASGRGLRELHLSSVGLTPEGCRALALHLQEGGGEGLQVLNLNGNRYMYDEGVAVLAEAFKSKACPGLTTLCLGCTSVGSPAVEVLVRALPELPALRLLALSENTRIGEGPGLEDLAEALGKGACPELQSLYLRDTGMIKEDALAFATTFGAGALPALRELDVGGNNIGDVGVAALVTALSNFPVTSRRGLTRLGLWDTRMGVTACKAVARAWRGGYWPGLRVLGLGTDWFTRAKEDGAQAFGEFEVGVLQALQAVQAVEVVNGRFWS